MIRYSNEPCFGVALPVAGATPRRSLKNNEDPDHRLTS